MHCRLKRVIYLWKIRVLSVSFNQKRNFSLDRYTLFSQPQSFKVILIIYCLFILYLIVSLLISFGFLQIIIVSIRLIDIPFNWSQRLVELWFSELIRRPWHAKLRSHAISFIILIICILLVINISLLSDLITLSAYRCIFSILLFMFLVFHSLNWLLLL